jgi:hypothetical protein
MISAPFVRTPWAARAATSHPKLWARPPDGGRFRSRPDLPEFEQFEAERLDLRKDAE